MEREKLASRLGFILLSAGCAIGIGNVYRFPIMTGSYGGGFFVLLYLLCLALLGIPVMVAELSVGRASQRSIASSFDVLEKKGQKWHLMKYMGIAGNYLLMMSYCFIASWMVSYFMKYLTGSIMIAKTAQELSTVFNDLASNPGIGVLSTYVVIFLCMGVCALGLQNGVEKITKVMMVMLFVLMFGLAIYSLTLSNALEGVKFYLVPSWANLMEAGVGNVLSQAMNQAFFTLSLGIGSIAIFGSYINKERRLTGEAITIIGLDTLVALIAGLIIFPACFTYNNGVTADAGSVSPKFLFTTLSSIFNGMAGGRIIGALFFLFMIFAAFSTVIAVFENIISFWLEMTKLNRLQACLINVGLLMVLVLPAIFSFSHWSNVSILGMNFFELEDAAVAKFMLPIGSLIYVLFCVTRYGMGWKRFSEEANSGSGLKLPEWVRPYMTYVLPVIIIIVFILSVI